MRLSTLATIKSFVRTALFVGLLIAALALLAGCGQQAQVPAATLPSEAAQPTEALTLEAATAPLPTAPVVTEAGEKSAVVEERRPAPSTTNDHTPAPAPPATSTPASASPVSEPTSELAPTPVPTAAPAAVAQRGHSETSGRGGWSPLFTELTGCEEKDVVFGVSPIDIDHISAVEPQES